MFKTQTAKIIDGLALSKKLLEQLRLEIIHIKQIQKAFQPSLAIIQIGNREDSNIYIRNKIKKAKQVGISIQYFKFDTQDTQSTIEDQINKLNDDKNTHGIIVQLPFETQEKLNTNRIVNTVSHLKDVDGLSDINAGKLANGNFDTAFIPCTPKGCHELIESTGLSLTGKNVVIIGRSRLIGTPLANYLKWHDATVTICHSKTLALSDICQRADVLIAAVGKIKLVKQDWIKRGATVIDCGINYSDGKIYGDVDFENASKVADFITPVPGGVGPMTVTMLLQNTLESAKRYNKF